MEFYSRGLLITAQTRGIHLTNANEKALLFRIFYSWSFDIANWHVDLFWYNQNQYEISSSIHSQNLTLLYAVNICFYLWVTRAICSFCSHIYLNLHILYHILVVESNKLPYWSTQQLPLEKSNKIWNYANSTNLSYQTRFFFLFGKWCHQ